MNQRHMAYTALLLKTFSSNYQLETIFMNSNSVNSN